jgi:hypothetical protein
MAVVCSSLISCFPGMLLGLLSAVILKWFQSPLLLRVSLCCHTIILIILLLLLLLLSGSPLHVLKDVSANTRFPAVHIRLVFLRLLHSSHFTYFLSTIMFLSTMSLPFLALPHRNLSHLVHLIFPTFILLNSVVWFPIITFCYTISSFLLFRNSSVSRCFSMLTKPHASHYLPP